MVETRLEAEVQVHKAWVDLLPVFWRLPRYARLGFGLARDNRLGAGRKAMLGGALVYSLSPLDMIPSVVPVLGQVDDVLILLLAVRAALADCPAPVRREHLSRTGLTHTQVREDPVRVRRALLRLLRTPGRLAGPSLGRGVRMVRAARRRTLESTRRSSGQRRRDD